MITRRFSTISFLLFFLILFSLFTSISTFKKRISYYNEDIYSHLFKLDPSRINMYSNVEIGFDRPPEKLSILAGGIGEKYGSCAIIRGKYGPTIIRSREKSNFFLFNPLPFDFIHVLGLVISLMAILLSYDTISGEREEGTLQLSLSNSIGKYKILLGEYIGAMLSLLIPLCLSFLGVIIILQLHPDISFDLEMLGEISVLFLNSVFLTSAFVMLGILISSLTRQSNTSLLSAFFIWVILVAIYPNLTSWISLYAKSVESLVELTSTNIITKMSPEHILEEKVQIDKNQKEFNLNKRFEQSDFENKLKLFSPFSTNILLSQIIAGTDVGTQKKFISQIKNLEQSFIKWQKEKLKKYPQRESFFIAGWGAVDLKDLPSNEFKGESLAERIERAIPYMASVLILNIILFYMSYIIFIKYDPRFG
ncbi:MAG: ABC transporter permease subunit [Acidobacteriota bacterium]